jgi:hypothetical protein
MTPQVSRRDFSKFALTAGVAVAAPAFAAPGRGKDVAWLREVQQPLAKVPDDAPKLTSLLVDSKGDKITSLSQWKEHRATVRDWWLDFLGPMPGKRDGAPKWNVIEEDRVEGVLRQRIRYEAEPGIATEAYLLQPEKQSGKLPGVAVFHSTVDHSIRQPAGVEGKPEKFFGLKLAQRGCVTISPRNYLWPTNDKIAAQQEADNFHKRHPKSKGMARMLHDSLIAVDILTSLPNVDAKRIGSVGHSLGAKEVLYLAAFDERVKVTVSSEGGVSCTFSNWYAPWYLGETIESRDFMHEHHELLALTAPRAFLLLGGDSADGDQSWPFIETALPVYKLYGETPRLGLFNHKKGHAVPPESEKRIYEWFDAYL